MTELIQLDTTGTSGHYTSSLLDDTIGTELRILQLVSPILLTMVLNEVVRST